MIGNMNSVDKVGEPGTELARYAVPVADRPRTVVHKGVAIETFANRAKTSRAARAIAATSS
jgi:hypothetical protein